MSMAQQPEDTSAFTSKETLSKYSLNELANFPKTPILNLLNDPNHYYFNEDRNPAEYQMVFKIGNPALWMRPSLERSPTDEKTEIPPINPAILERDRIEGDQLPRVRFLGEEFPELDGRANNLTQINRYKSPQNEKDKKEYQFNEDVLIKAALSQVAQEGLLEDAIAVLPFDGARLFGPAVEEFELPVLSAKFSRIQRNEGTPQEDMIVTIDGLGMTQGGKPTDLKDKAIKRAVLVDDCLSSGGSSLAALDLLEGKVSELTIVCASYANVDAIAMLINEGDKRGIKVRVRAAKRNDKVDEHYYLVRNTQAHWDGAISDPKLQNLPVKERKVYAVGDMGAWAQPVSGQIPYGMDYPAANIRRLGKAA